MFTYFCCRCFFRIIFTSINLCYKRIRICINNKWCFIKFSVLIKLKLKIKNLIFWCLPKASEYYKNLYFHILFYMIQVLFLFRKNEDNSGHKNHVFTLFFLIIQIIFLHQHNAILIRLESLKE